MPGVAPDKLPTIAYPAAGARPHRRVIETLDPHVIVLFGATGDLAKRKLIPGLAYLEESSLAPDIETVAEAGIKGVEYSAWVAFFVPAGVPREIASRLAAELLLIVGSPAIHRVVVERARVRCARCQAARNAVAAARRLPLSTIGFLQYLAPTGQFITALAALGEHLSRRKLVAFGFIWVALAVFTVELVRQARAPVLR